MIEFEKINQKGDKLKAYTHRSYLSQKYNDEICRIEKRNKNWSGVALYGTTILSYWALANVPVLNHLVQNKIAFKGKFLVVAAAVGLIDSFVTSLFLTKSLKSSHENLLKSQVFPAWFNRERVVNPSRVYFQLDDARNNEPNIWHSGMYFQILCKHILSNSKHCTRFRRWRSPQTTRSSCLTPPLRFRTKSCQLRVIISQQFHKNYLIERLVRRSKLLIFWLCFYS